jgi:hypothetical protein
MVLCEWRAGQLRPGGKREPVLAACGFTVQGFQVHRGGHSHAPPDQRFDILKLDAKHSNVIGTAHTASLAALSLQRNCSPFVAGGITSLHRPDPTIVEVMLFFVVALAKLSVPSWRLNS